MSTKESDTKPKPTAKSAERATITLEGLKKEFGDKEGEAKYFAIAGLEREMTHPVTGEKYMARVYFDPVTEGPSYRPELVIATQPAELRRQVADIISTPQVKE